MHVYVHSWSPNTMVTEISDFSTYICDQDLSLSTLVLNTCSRDQHETKWQPNFTLLKTHLLKSYA